MFFVAEIFYHRLPASHKISAWFLIKVNITVVRVKRNGSPWAATSCSYACHKDKDCSIIEFFVSTIAHATYVSTELTFFTIRVELMTVDLSCIHVSWLKDKRRISSGQCPPFGKRCWSNRLQALGRWIRWLCTSGIPHPLSGSGIGVGKSGLGIS